MKWTAAIVLIAACSSHDDAAPAPSPKQVIDARVPVAHAPLPRGTWRLPILLITKDTVELRWRVANASDEVVVTQPLASWTCPPLHDPLVAETKRTWGRTPVRPPESEQLLVAVDPKAPDAITFAILNCVNDPSAPRPPYKDVVIQPEPSQ